VRCTNSNCSWTGQHSEKERHWDTCPFMLVECPNGCIGNRQHSALDEHLAACPYDKVSCMFCSVGHTWKTVCKALCYVPFSAERDYQGNFNCTLEVRALSFLKANYRSNKSQHKMLSKQSLSDQTSN